MIDAAIRGFVKFALWLRYRTEVTGVRQVAALGRTGILFLPNHPALIDPVIMLAVLHKDFRAKALADAQSVDRFLIRTLARRAGVVTFPDPQSADFGHWRRMQQALAQCCDCLRRGENMILYPSGQILRGKLEDLRGNSAVEHILRACPDVRIVLVRTGGLWGSCFSWASGRDPRPLLGRMIARCLLALVANGLFFTPRRRVTIELHEPSDFPRDGDRQEINRYIETFHNACAPDPTHPSHVIWCSQAKDGISCG